ncbi:MAG TPA: DUF2752 domain-containing protein [Myxococcaceae bacterium]|nr:DUF2752 domain-containing protein [Myxococcaceae bacterium]
MRLEWPVPNRRFGVLDALAVTGLVGLLVARFVPVARLPFWGCAFREMTGWPCPGCGLTRAADRISHLNFAGAWDANPLGTIAAVGFLVAILLSALHLAFRMPMPSVRLTATERTGGYVLLALAVLLNWSWVVMKTRFPELLAGG